MDRIRSRYIQYFFKKEPKINGTIHIYTLQKKSCVTRLYRIHDNAIIILIGAGIGKFMIRVTPGFEKYVKASTFEQFSSNFNKSHEKRCAFTAQKKFLSVFLLHLYHLGQN